MPADKVPHHRQPSHPLTADRSPRAPVEERSRPAPRSTTGDRDQAARGGGAPRQGALPPAPDVFCVTAPQGSSGYLRNIAGDAVPGTLPRGWTSDLTPADNAIDVAARDLAAAWVGDALTRGGRPRWHRVSGCGTPWWAWRPSEGGGGTWGWAHKRCRDRACRACQVQRGRVIRAHATQTIGETPAGYVRHFVTLTLPQERGWRAEQARREAVRAWTDLLDSPDWRRRKSDPGHGVHAAFRVHEIKWSKGLRWGAKPHWNAHVHAIVEVAEQTTEGCPACHGSAKYGGKRCRACTRGCGDKDCTDPKCEPCTTSTRRPLTIARLVSRWCTRWGSSPAAQCVLPLVGGLDRIGLYLTKYLTKAWDKCPPKRARELWDAVAGWRLWSMCGAWRCQPRPTLPAPWILQVPCSHELPDRVLVTADRTVAVCGRTALVRSAGLWVQAPGDRTAAAATPAHRQPPTRAGPWKAWCASQIDSVRSVVRFRTAT